MESGQFVRIKESFLGTDSYANDPSLIETGLATWGGPLVVLGSYAPP